jgi:hypothetical protein
MTLDAGDRDTDQSRTRLYASAWVSVKPESSLSQVTDSEFSVIPKLSSSLSLSLGPESCHDMPRRDQWPGKAGPESRAE